MNPLRSLRPAVYLLAIALTLAPLASAVSIQSVYAELYDLDDPRNLVDVRLKQSSDPWKDKTYPVNGQDSAGIIRVQAENKDLNSDQRTNVIHGYWNADWDSRWMDHEQGRATVSFADHSVSSIGNPLHYFFHQFYGDSVRLIWTNNPDEPHRVPETASTIVLLGLGLGALVGTRRVLAKRVSSS